MGGSVLESTDGGAHWSSVYTGQNPNTFPYLAIDPKTPATLYAATYSSGVYKSVDGAAQAYGNNQGTVRVTSQTQGVLQSPQDVIVTLNLLQPALSVTPSMVAWNLQQYNQGAHQDLDVTNTGTWAMVPTRAASKAPRRYPDARRPRCPAQLWRRRPPRPAAAPLQPW
jgi:hypothetical protein